jgi:hypothetical protein
LGETHALHEPESSEHWKLEPLSVELKSKLALVETVVAGGPEVTEVSGAVVSRAEAGEFAAVRSRGCAGLTRP